MGQKHSNFHQSNRPESGGANKDERLEKSGVLERDKEKFSASREEQEREEHPRERHASEKPRDERDVEERPGGRPEPREVDREDRGEDRDPGHS